MKQQRNMLGTLKATTFSKHYLWHKRTGRGCWGAAAPPQKKIFFGQCWTILDTFRAILHNFGHFFWHF
jgi:hypothetical protein